MRRATWLITSALISAFALNTACDGDGEAAPSASVDAAAADGAAPVDGAAADGAVPADAPPAVDSSTTVNEDAGGVEQTDADGEAVDLLFEAHFDDGELGAPCDGADGFGTAFSESVRDDTHVYAGAAACRIGVSANSQGWGQFGGFFPDVGLESGDEIWVKLSLYVPGEWEWNSGRSKFVRLRMFHGLGGESHGYLDWYLATNDEINPHAWISEGQAAWRVFGEPSDQVVADTWEHYEIYYFLDHVPVSEGGQGRVRVWKNGTLLVEITDRRTLEHDVDVVKDLLIFTWFGNEGAPRDQVLWIDELQVATTEPPRQDENGFPFLGVAEKE